MRSCATSVATQTDNGKEKYLEDKGRTWLLLKLIFKSRLAADLPPRPAIRKLGASNPSGLLASVDSFDRHVAHFCQHCTASYRVGGFEFCSVAYGSIHMSALSSAASYLLRRRGIQKG